jgi:hypothetical protein
MSEIERIRDFLRAVRRRAYWEASLRTGGATLAGLLLALLVMALCASHTGPATFWPKVTATVLIFLTLLGVALGALGPFRRLRNERGVADFVGRRHPPLASDLVSAVELSAENPLPLGTSGGILRAFFGSVATSVAPVDVRQLVPMRAAAFSGIALAGAGVALLASALLLPELIGHGLALLTRTPTRFEGAAVSTEPLIGDVRLTYVYPAYTRLPRATSWRSRGPRCDSRPRSSAAPVTSDCSWARRVKVANGFPPSKTAK